VAAAASPITALVFPGGNVNEVFFIANNNHLWQMLSADNNVWASDDVTSQGGGPAANPANGIVAFTTTPNDELHLFYLSKKHINQLSLPAGTDDWQNQDLTAEYGGNRTGPAQCRLLAGELAIPVLRVEVKPNRVREGAAAKCGPSPAAAKLAPRWNPHLAALHARELERGHRNRGTLAVARKFAA